MEGMLASWHEETRNCEVTPCPTLIHPEHAWIIATPDRVVQDEPVLVECKHVGERVAWHWMDGPPDYVRAQCVWQMFVANSLGMGVNRVDVVADIGGAPPAIFPVDFDAELEEMMFDAAKSFWVDHVLADVPPTIDGSASYQAWIRRQFPNSNGVMLDAPEAERWAKEYVAGKNAIKEGTMTAELAANHLRVLIGENDGARGPWGRVTNRVAASGTRTIRVSLYDGTTTRKRRRGRARMEDLDL